MSETHDDCPLCRLEASWREAGKSPHTEDPELGFSAWSLNDVNFDEYVEAWVELASRPGAVVMTSDEVAELTGVAPPRPSRNDLCWCGSGIKYKRCHLSIDNN